MRELILRNYRKQNKYLQTYLSAIRGNIVNGQLQEDGLIQMNIQELPLNPTIETSQFSMDYEQNARERLSSLIREDNTGQKMKKIVDEIKNVDITFPMVLSLNWKALSNEIMSSYSGRRVNNEQDFVNFLVAKLTEYKLRQQQQGLAPAPAPVASNPTPAPSPLMTPIISSRSSPSNSVITAPLVPASTNTLTPPPPALNRTPSATMPVGPATINMAQKLAPSMSSTKEAVELATILTDVSYFTSITSIDKSMFISDVADGAFTIGNLRSLADDIVNYINKTESNPQPMLQELDAFYAKIQQLDLLGINVSPDPSSFLQLNPSLPPAQGTPMRQGLDTKSKVNSIFSSAFYQPLVVAELREILENVVGISATSTALMSKPNLQEKLNESMVTAIDGGDVAKFDDIVFKFEGFLSAKGKPISKTKMKGIRGIKNSQATPSGQPTSAPLPPSPPSSPVAVGKGLKGGFKQLIKQKYAVDLKKLGAGLLSVRYIKSRSQHPNLKEQFVSPEQRKLILLMLNGEFNQTLYNSLPKMEQHLIKKLIHHFELNIDVGEDETLYERWNIVKNMLKNGHNGEGLKQECKMFLQAFRETGLINTTQMLRYYAELGLN